MSMRVRDTVVGDIRFNDLEDMCIRTPTFQRLHRLKQLGNAFHVYPGATHTRFEHSLGVCYQVQRLLSQENLLYYCSKERKNLKHDAEAIRLAALLHDIVHTPFLHTLDRDTKIIPEANRENEYKIRIDQISREIKSLFHKEFPEELKSTVLGILKHDKALDLEKPYYKQIIEDTLSGDLLDYTLRDCYYTGINRKWDLRIYDHIAVAFKNGKPHLVANLLDETGKIAQSAITEITNLIDIRYTLNERVYFYSAKIAADSLLIRSLRTLFTTTENNHTTFHDVSLNMSDEELVNYLIEKPKYSKINYAEYLKHRMLPRLATELSTDLTEDMKTNIVNNCSGHECYQAWLDVEADIAQEAGISPEEVIVYCHDLQMQGKKKPEFLILFNNNKEPCPLGQYPPLKDEIAHIAEKHENLWRTYVFSLNRDDRVCKKIEKASKRVLTSLRAKSHNYPT